MVRIFGILAGLFFVAALSWSLAIGAYTAITEAVLGKDDKAVLAPPGPASASAPAA